MNKTLILALLSLFIIEDIVAHGGRTNSEGCHNNRKTGGYHCHGGSSSYSGSSYKSKTKYSASNGANSPSLKSTIQESSDLVLQTQKYLNILGHNVGPEDGILGSRTIKAIKAFQKKIYEDVNGTPSYSLLKKLKRAAND